MRSWWISFGKRKFISSAHSKSYFPNSLLLETLVHPLPGGKDTLPSYFGKMPLGQATGGSSEENFTTT